MSDLDSSDRRAPGHLFLWGFMGSGKSTVGRLLAERLGRPFIDLDARIEARLGRIIADVFAADGEDAFRAHELESLRDLSAVPASVVAAGGGAPVLEDSRQTMAQLGWSCWLDVAFEEICDRLDAAARARRPLFDSVEKACSLFNLRRPVYAEAELRCQVERGESALDTTDKIVRHLRDFTLCAI
ncbi:MAG: shikimate kinase [Acidobacteriota bacterium]